MSVAAPASVVRTAAALVPGWIGCRAYDVDGARIGHVADVLFDAYTNAPGWLLLALPGREDGFVLAPAAGLRHHVEGVTLACRRARVREAPSSPLPPDSLAARHAAALAVYYGVRGGGGPWHGIVEPTLVGASTRMRAGRPG
jgi:hypothetical protein